MWKGMQIVAIVALVIAIGILYKSRTRQVFEFLIEILSRTRQAKLGSFEIEISKELQDISKRLIKKAAWVQVILPELSSDDIGVLLSLSNEERNQANEALKGQLRSLRKKGLIAHNKPTLAESSEVWLTELGRDLVSVILEPEVQKEIGNKQ